METQDQYGRCLWPDSRSLLSSSVEGVLFDDIRFEAYRIDFFDIKAPRTRTIAIAVRA